MQLGDEIGQFLDPLFQLRHPGVGGIGLGQQEIEFRLVHLEVTACHAFADTRRPPPLVAVNMIEKSAIVRNAVVDRPDIVETGEPVNVELVPFCDQNGPTMFR